MATNGGLLEDFLKSFDGRVNKQRECDDTVAEKNSLFCCSCKEEIVKAEFFCRDCSRSLICKECADIHKTVPAFIGHSVETIELELSNKKTYQKCKVHEGPLNSFCSSCIEFLCGKCIREKHHVEHQVKIVDLNKGLNEVKELIATRNATLDEKLNELYLVDDLLKKEKHFLEKTKTDVSDKQKKVKKLLDKLNNDLEQLCDCEKSLTNLHEAAKKQKMDLESLKAQSADLEKVNLIANLPTFKDWQTKSEDIIESIELTQSKKFVCAEYIPHSLEKIPQTEQVNIQEISLRSMKERNIQENIEKEDDDDKETGNIKEREVSLENVKLREPRDIVSLGDGTVILVDEKLSFVQRIDPEGNVIKKYSLGKFSMFGTYISSACVFGKYIFLASFDDTIKRLLLDEQGGTKTYKPKGITTDYITAIGDDNLLISEHNEPGRIVQYRAGAEKISVKVSNISNPMKVHVACTQHGAKYLINWGERESMTANVSIYNHEWKPITTIDLLDSPMVLTVTSEKVLIANHTTKAVYVYDMDGMYNSDIICPIGKPSSMIYKEPYLTVLEENPSYCLKMFNLNNKL